MNRQRRKIKFKNFTAVFVFISFMLYLTSCLFLRSYNNSLSLKLQSTKSKISALQVENDSIEVAIQTLSNRDRVVSIANENGLQLNQSNIITITSGD